MNQSIHPSINSSFGVIIICFLQNNLRGIRKLALCKLYERIELLISSLCNGAGFSSLDLDRRRRRISTLTLTLPLACGFFIIVEVEINFNSLLVQKKHNGCDLTTEDLPKF
mmetsp:Transcript_12443/g.18701  ORF Transcript_12443/g.18701 Transcript_12443/m.18701 type:complete len:111 (+) Transcript_12443:197-529(+)